MSFDPAAALEDLRRSTTDRLAALTGDYAGIVEASKDSNADDEHDPEGSTIAFERSQVGTLVEDARQRLAEIEAARARLAEGSYGSCEQCGRPIGEGRLEARPTARKCIDCASRGEGGP
jgi:RNA polymerase-binding protein DksA